MRAILVIALHHLWRTVRSPGRVLLMAAVPVTIALIEYAAFGSTAAAGKLPAIRVLFIDEDKTFASGAVPQLFTGGPLKESFTVTTVEDRPAAVPLFERNEAAALVVVPVGFQDALLAGRRAELELYKNPLQTFSPEVVASVLEMGATLGNGLYGRATGPIRGIRELVGAGRTPTEDEIAEISRGLFRAAQSFGKVGGLGDVGVAVERPGAQATTRIGVNPGEFFATLFPGLVLFGLMFISQVLALRLLRDRTRGLQRRLLTTPVSSTAAILGSMLFLVTALVVMLGVLGLLATAVFRVHLRAPAALLAFGFGFAAFTAGMQLTVGALAASDRGARAISSGVIMLLSLLGGSFVPIEGYPPLLRQVARLVPNGAAQQGMLDVLVRQRPAVDLAPAAAVVWLWAAAGLLLAFVVERRRLAT